MMDEKLLVVFLIAAKLCYGQGRHFYREILILNFRITC